MLLSSGARAQATHILDTVCWELYRTEVVNTIPMNWSFDYFNGVSFDKGCYLGQELMSRTKHSVRRSHSPRSLHVAADVHFVSDDHTCAGRGQAAICSGYAGRC